MNKSVPVMLAAAATLMMPHLVSALDIGDKAPPLEIQEWIKGEPLGADGGRGKILLIEFWATW